MDSLRAVLGGSRKMSSLCRWQRDPKQSPLGSRKNEEKEPSLQSFIQASLSASSSAIQPSIPPQHENIFPPGSSSVFTEQRKTPEQEKDLVAPRKDTDTCGGHDQIQKSSTSLSHYQPSTSPSEYYTTWSSINLPKQVIMDLVSFCGLVVHYPLNIRNDAYSAYYPLASGRDERSGVVDFNINEEIALFENQNLKKTVTDAAYNLLLSCGKIYVKWPGSSDRSEREYSLSGFWLEGKAGKFFITACHFHKYLNEAPLTDVEAEQRMCSMRDGYNMQGMACYVGSRISEAERGPHAIKVKLKAWDLSADTAIFEVNASRADISHFATLKDIGHMEDVRDHGTKRRVFTAGYCASDIVLDSSFLKGNGMSPAEAARVVTSPTAPATIFDFYKASYREAVVQGCQSHEASEKLDFLDQKMITFQDVFKPNQRAAATGRMSIMPPPYESSSPYTILTETDLSLFHGLSGSPVVRFMGIDRGGWQIIAMVQGGLPDQQGNKLTAFKQVYKLMLASVVDN